MRHKNEKFWERFLITDEKIWTVDGYFNPQNDRVRAKCKENVEVFADLPGHQINGGTVPPSLALTD